MNGMDMMRVMNDLDVQYLKEAERPRPTRRISVRAVNVAASIVLAFAIVLPIAAYATGFLHPENVDFYLEGVEANDQIVKNIEMENQDLKLTLDAQLCDGHNVLLIYTYEAKTAHGEELWEFPILGEHLLIQYEEGSESPYYDSQAESPLPRFAGMQSGCLSLGTDPADVHRFIQYIPCKGIDLTRSLRIDYYVNSEDPFGFATSELNPNGKYTFQIAPWLENELDGFSYVTDFAPNVPVAVFSNADGDKIHMSAFELWSDTVYMTTEATVLIREDGERVSLERENSVGPINGYEINPNLYLHPEEYAAVEFNGVLFERETN